VTPLPAEVDVLVVGFGAAGASAAIAAHDSGARVAVVEKLPVGGGNCRYSGGFLFDVEEPVAVDHLDAVCFGKTDRGVLRALADGLHELDAWLESLGGRTAPVDLAAFNGMLPCWPHLPGAGRVHYRQFVPADDERAGQALWTLLERAVADRAIPVALGTAASSLLVEEGAVRGAVVGAVQEVRARGGVVLACGSFESDPVLRDAYLSLPVVAVGHPGNTGDSIALAQQADGSLWHMAAFFGWFCFVHPDYPAGFTLDVRAPSFVMLDGDGRRFADETGWEVHDRVRAATAYLPRRRNRPRMPGWIVFDEAARLAGPLHGIVGSPNGYSWSVDNSAEVQRGWIKRGSDAGELASATGLDATMLAQTLDGYAAAVAAGRDDEFGRAPETLVALEPPLYAIPMQPGVATASGGPRRDAFARIVRSSGVPIPGLYGAGAAGSVWGHLTEHGGGLTDAIVFGRIAGAHAANSCAEYVHETRHGERAVDRWRQI
jgi:succinate dehydrogenase/fumarate reductase flavoprotein subunit